MKKTRIQEIKSKTEAELRSLARELKAKRIALSRDLRIGKTTVLKEYAQIRKELAVALTALNEKIKKGSPSA